MAHKEQQAFACLKLHDRGYGCRFSAMSDTCVFGGEECLLYEVLALKSGAFVRAHHFVEAFPVQ
jgi:hypothetical protein